MTRRHCLLALAWLIVIACGCSSASHARTQTVGALQVGPASGTRLVPQDDGSRDPSFDAFRKRLRQAVSKRDTAFLESVLDPQVHVSFGPDERGLAAFRRVWRPDDDKSELWPKLQATLALAAARDNDAFWIPYVYTRWPADLDPHGHAVVVSENATLRDRPGADGSALAQLSYDVVRVVGGERGRGDWQRVATRNGVEGYVPASVLVGPTGLRIKCVNDGGRWRIAVLLEGD